MSESLAKKLVEKYPLTGPYYTSYPAVGQWDGQFTDKKFVSALDDLFTSDKNTPLSLYLHYPFCPELCTYCSCHVIISSDQERMDSFLSSIFKEIDILREYFNSRSITPNIKEIHLGGGSPSVISRKGFEQLIARLETLVDVKTLEQFAIEVDVRTVDKEMMEFYHEQGINRVSFGVQDFNPDVQKAVNRIQPVELIEKVITPDVRKRFKSINFDILWGLPFQTRETFRETIKTLKTLSPNRVTLLHYGHFPDIYKHQVKINKANIPSEFERFMFNMEAITDLESSGYEWIGLDHIANKNDEMVEWKSEQRLNRGFIGYTCEYKNLIGLGPSALSSFGKYFGQNTYGLSDYNAAVDKGIFPTFRGYESSFDILIRSKIISELINYSFVNLKDIGNEFGVDFHNYFDRELESMDDLIDDGLMELTESSITVTPMGRYFVRHICMIFDIFLQKKSVHKPTSRRDSKLAIG
jgi:oxygen-independent coproporphyrinogen-3 oxidase